MWKKSRNIVLLSLAGSISILFRPGARFRLDLTLGLRRPFLRAIRHTVGEHVNVNPLNS
jgi:hypothetical protein